MSKRLLEYDAHRGLRIDYEDMKDGTFALHYTQDVEPVIELNKAKQKMGRAYFASDPDIWKVASIPVIVQYEWAKRYGITDVTKPEYHELIRRLLNSNEWRYLKTADVII